MSGIARVTWSGIVALVVMGVGGSPAFAQDEFGDRRVSGLQFIGNSAISDYALSRAISTSNSSLLARWNLPLGVTRMFDETEFRRDVLRLILLYRQTGYMDVAIDTVVQRTERDVKIRFFIREGEPVLVSAIRVEGTEGIVPAATLIRDLPLRVGGTFDRLQLRAATDSIRLDLQNRGYALAEVYRSFEVDRALRQVTVTFTVYPGPLSTVGEVRVAGNRRISERLIRRSVAMRPGDRFRYDDIFESQRTLYGLNVFNFVDVRVDSTTLLAGDSVVDFDVRVSEGRMRTLRAGFGYGTVDCLRLLTGLRLNSVLGDARALDITARFSKIGTLAPFSFENSICGHLGDEPRERKELNYTLSASLRFPGFFSRNTRADLTVSQEKYSEFQAYLREAVGFNFAVTRSMSRSLSLTLSYDLSYGSTRADDATFCSFLNVCRQQDIAQFTRDLFRSTLGMSATLNRANAIINPNRGWRLFGEVRWASPQIGSDSLVRFTRLVGEVTAFQHALGQSVLAFRLRTGTIQSNRLGIAAQDVRFVPIEERFYAGGPNSVRGFGQNQLGPVVRRRIVIVDTVTATVDTTITTAATGGNSLVVANLELRFLLPGFSRRLSAAFFVDAGRVFEREAGQFFRLEGIRFTPGVGIRFATPIGPIRADVAYNPYDPERGLLFEEINDELVEISSDFSPPGPAGFWQRLQLNIAIGQAF